MLKRLCELLMIGMLVACVSEKSELSQDNRVELGMSTTGVGNFADYVHSLGIYAFQRSASGSYVFYKTLANFDEAGIASLADVSERGNAKYYTTRLPVGFYELYFVANALGGLEGRFETGITTPGDLALKGNEAGQDSVYFIGKLALRVVTDVTSPVSVTLSRVVSKLVVVLDGVPSQISAIRLTVGNIAANYPLDGVPSSRMLTVEKTFVHANPNPERRDTVVYEMLMLPTVGDASPFSITFQAENGQERVKEMPPLKLLPDKYVRVTGTVSDAPGALLSFDVAVNIFIFDMWGDESLPDFSVKPSE